MPHEQVDVLKVGDIVEFHCAGNPKPVQEWDPQVVTEIRVVEDVDDKEGVPVSEIG